jgi:hypothetical protein
LGSPSLSLNPLKIALFRSLWSRVIIVAIQHVCWIRIDRVKEVREKISNNCNRRNSKSWMARTLMMFPLSEARLNRQSEIQNKQSDSCCSITTFTRWFEIGDVQKTNRLFCIRRVLPRAIT